MRRVTLINIPVRSCSAIWAAFEQAYVGKDPCEVPMEAYDSVVAAVPFTPACNRMMFWSKTKDMVQDFTKKKNCFVRLEDSPLGYMLDGLTWCGKEGSSETLTEGCPRWTKCENNPVRSFWRRASASFADAACGDVTAVLNGSIPMPFNPTSVFATIEVKRFKSATMKSLTVVLVAQNFVTNCADASLMNLQRELDTRIQYNCKEVKEADIRECMSHKDKPCGPCW
ncbi:ADP-ribosyl cyclase/cyclic ADP-ribose hydrolase 1-like isoform X2 [Pempheris klunzingeri]|uniref:ADP-ribosyl cyclase/cyclic ADP-ribose hydrolase 1-like isoform X2 n=1 Tax=Pempheris klunzingeri TaxID=3127111 RepID=UPI0039809985